MDKVTKSIYETVATADAGRDGMVRFADSDLVLTLDPPQPMEGRQAQER